jgi:hypothetical protein
MDIPFYTLQEGICKLEYMIKTREKSKETSFYEDWKRDCQNFADRLIEAGANEKDIMIMLEWKSKGNCYYGVLQKF